MSDLQIIKKEQYEAVLSHGYSKRQAKKVANSIVSITGYFHGKPSRVKTNEGLELWLF